MNRFPFVVDHQDAASCIDLDSRRPAGWAMADHMRTGLVSDALLAALRERGTLNGAVFHSDHGSVYTSRAFTALCEELGVVQSPCPQTWVTAP